MNKNNSYPDEISLEGETLDFLKKHSELISTLHEIQNNEGPLILDADLLFQGNKDHWKLFYDLFFPEGSGKLFEFRGENVVVSNSRGGKEALKEIMDYLMVDTPKTMINFAKAQARKQINAPAKTVTTESRAKGKQPNLAENNNNNNSYNDFNEGYGATNNYIENVNTNTNENNGPKMGYAEEEEEYLSKLKGKNIRTYYGNERRKANRRAHRSTRRRNNTHTGRKNRRGTHKNRT